MIIIFFSTSITKEIFSQKNKDFVFDDGMFTRINRNSMNGFLYANRFQVNPSYVFKHTRVVECSKDKKLKEIGTLGSIEKEGSKSTNFKRFEKFVEMNNAIYCCNIEQKLNYYDNLEDVGAIIYGTQDVKDCALLKAYLKEQKLAEEQKKTEAAVSKK